jgi:hypothetical protein
MSAKTPLTDLEKRIVAKLEFARFPPGTASKRFAHALNAGYVKELSSKGRRFLAYVAHRFRRQYPLFDDEKAWIAEWIDYKEEPPPAKVKPVPIEPEIKESQPSFDFTGMSRETA